MDHIIVYLNGRNVPTVIDADKVTEKIYFEDLTFFNADDKTIKILEGDYEEDFQEIVGEDNVGPKVFENFISLDEIKENCEEYKYALVNDFVHEAKTLVEWESDFYFENFTGSGYETLIVDDYKYIDEDCKVEYIKTSRGFYNDENEEWDICNRGQYDIYKNSKNDYFIFYNSYYVGAMPEPKDGEGIKKYTKEQVEELFGEDIFE